MATKDDKRQKFIALLHAQFQLDQPDLDFGFYPPGQNTHAAIVEYSNTKRVRESSSTGDRVSGELLLIS